MHPTKIISREPFASHTKETNSLPHVRLYVCRKREKQPALESNTGILGIVTMKQNGCKRRVKMSLGWLTGLSAILPLFFFIKAVARKDALPDLGF